MVKEYEEMDYSKNYTYKDKKIYISYETKKYILCSFNENGKPSVNPKNKEDG